MAATDGDQDSNDVWRVMIDVTNGVPRVWSEPTLTNRKYTVFGKHLLSDPDLRTDVTNAHFFKMQVELQ